MSDIVQLPLSVIPSPPPPMALAALSASIAMSRCRRQITIVHKYPLISSTPLHPATQTLNSPLPPPLVHCPHPPRPPSPHLTAAATIVVAVARSAHDRGKSGWHVGVAPHMTVLGREFPLILVLQLGFRCQILRIFFFSSCVSGSSTSVAVFLK
jgi:hypothetical protein